ncbi:hypothetical protein ES708_10493 [subsurface metagenome]
MGEIIARFADGRLLVQEDRLMDTAYLSGGVPIRIGLVGTVEKVISIDTMISGRPGQNVAAPLNEVKVGVGALSGPLGGGISGNRRDIIIPILRRHDLFGFTSGLMMQSGYSSVDALSGLVLSGTIFGGQLSSGCATSGYLRILANVIGF